MTIVSDRMFRAYRVQRDLVKKARASGCPWTISCATRSITGASKTLKFTSTVSLRKIWFPENMYTHKSQLVISCYSIMLSCLVTVLIHSHDTNQLCRNLGKALNCIARQRYSFKATIGSCSTRISCEGQRYKYFWFNHFVYIHICSKKSNSTIIPFCVRHIVWLISFYKYSRMFVYWQIIKTNISIFYSHKL